MRVHANKKTTYVFLIKATRERNQLFPSRDVIMITQEGCQGN